MSIFIISASYNTANAQSFATEVADKTTRWIEVQSVVVPFDLPVNTGTTSTGKPKYWFTFKEIGDVTISATNYKKYTSKSEYIELVKWEKGDKCKYTTRAKSKSNIDLTKLFKNNLEN